MKCFVCLFINIAASKYSSGQRIDTTSLPGKIIIVYPDNHFKEIEVLPVEGGNFIKFKTDDFLLRRLNTSQKPKMRNHFLNLS